MHPDQPVPGTMEAQLASLYAERLQLYNAIGTADAQQVIAMVRSLEAQLVSLYQSEGVWTNPEPVRG